jgi:hypothetical protein
MPGSNVASQSADKAALDYLAAFLWEDPEQFPGGADTCEALDAVLRRTGREPKPKKTSRILTGANPDPRIWTPSGELE